MQRSLPAGTVTFLFTDVEGSTKLLHELGAAAYAEALARHRRIVREACGRHGGAEVDTQGDAFFVAFPTAAGALAAAREVCEALSLGRIRVRVGVHTGTPLLTDEGYVGADVHRAARIAACGHGGQILASSATAALVGDGLRDLGVHRLKDLSAPERIYQLGAADFPPLTSLHQTNLPIPTTPFLGREKELGEVLGLLSRADVRLLTLTGPGGTGKTRLGAQAAGALAERYPHGVWWVPLAALRDPALVAESAAQTLGARDGLADHVGDKSMLLLFDNFEHLVEAAGDVAAVLQSCPNLEVLVTSREPLHVSGEQEYAVPPFVHEEGVGFFLARARAVDPAFQPDDAMSEICRRLDDLPLALELAAARVKALSPQQILDRLERRLPLLTGGARDLPERQRTLRATIEWSYDLLTSEEQQLFARLAVFRGGCTLEAAEQVGGADLDTLQSLVDKSLLRHSGDRYWVLETIREYAADQLDATGEAAEMGRRHAEYFLAFAESAGSVDWRWSPGEWPEQFEREHDNFRRALDWLERERENEPLLRLASALWRFWQVRGHRSEGQRRLEAALAANPRRSAARARALNGLAVMYVERGDGASALPFAAEALAINRQLGDAWGAAFSQSMLGQAASEAGRHEDAQRFFERSCEEFRAIGDENYALLSSRMIGGTFYMLGDRRRARELHEHHLRWARAIGNRTIEGDMLGTLADYALEEARLDDARPLLREAARLFREHDDEIEAATHLRFAARFLEATDKPEEATRLLAASEAIRDALDFKRDWFGAVTEDDLRPLRAALGNGRFETAWREGLALSLAEALIFELEALGD